MKIRRVVVTALLSAVSLGFAAPDAFAAPGDAPNTRVTYPTAISAEILGRGLLYSVNFEQVVSEDFGVGIGFSSVSTEFNGQDANQSATLLPVFMNYYFKRTAGSPFVTGGANVILNAQKVRSNTSTVGSLDFPSDAILPTFGLGYESRTDTGFLFRGTAYLLVGDDVTPWLGFTFGYCF